MLYWFERKYLAYKLYNPYWQFNKKFLQLFTRFYVIIKEVSKLKNKNKNPSRWEILDWRLSKAFLFWNATTRRFSSFLHPLMEGLDGKKWRRKIYNSSGGSIHSWGINQREMSALFLRKSMYLQPQMNFLVQNTKTQQNAKLQS